MGFTAYTSVNKGILQRVYPWKLDGETHDPELPPTVSPGTLADGVLHQLTVYHFGADNSHQPRGIWH